MTETLPGSDRALVRVSAWLAAAGAAADHDELRVALRDAATVAEPRAVEEALLQSYLFLGYPCALNAFRLWRAVAPGGEGQQAEGKRAEHSGAEGSGASVGAAAPADWSGWTERGEAVCRTVYGGQYEGLRGNVRALHPDMEQWMVTEGYGKVLGRPGLDLATRELCVVALLAVAVAPAQLYSHLRGALNAGASPEAVEEALAIAARASSDEAVTLARETWRRVRRRPSEEGVG